MAYGKRFYFVFDSLNGTAWAVDILEDGYTGAAQQRHLGRAPVLKREENDGVCGSSLELYAETQQDGEFADLYTTDPYRFKVEVRQNGALFWEGYVTPEIYSEPDIAPPYDVQILATDGLGELKFSDYGEHGLLKLRSLLQLLLSKTGLTRDVFLINTINGRKPQVIGANRLLDDFAVDFDHMADESCYDVLKALLSSFNARLLGFGGHWFFVRETDIEVVDGLLGYWNAAGRKNYLDTTAISSLAQGSNAWWPVGRLVTSIVPAKRRVTVTSEAHYRDSAIPAGAWRATAGVEYDEETGAYRMQAPDYLGNSLILSDQAQSNTPEQDWLSESLCFKFRVRNLTELAATDQPSSHIYVTIAAYGRGNSPANPVYLHEGADVTQPNGYHWGSSTPHRIALEVEGPNATDNSSDAKEFTLFLPAGFWNSSSFFYVQKIEFKLENTDGQYKQEVLDLAVTLKDLVTGYKDVLKLDNGARETADDIELGLTRLRDTDYHAGLNFFQTGLLLVNGTTKAALTYRSAGTADEVDLLQLMSRDYAFGVAAPRLKKTGTLNVPQGGNPALVFFDRDDIAYWLNSFEWDLLNDELEVEMVSLPSVALEIGEEKITQITD